MKLKYKNKYYCVSQCAKDKFERYILEPLIAIATALILVVAGMTFLSIVGFITEGILISFFNYQANMMAGTWIAKGVTITIIFAFIITICLWIMEEFRNLNDYIKYRASEEYSRRYKPECKLFVECK